MSYFPSNFQVFTDLQKPTQAETLQDEAKERRELASTTVHDTFGT
jgi:hypothetical protein